MKDFTIGKIAKEAGVGIETVRFYERKGLIKQPKKNSGAFRIYAPEEAQKIRFIKRAQELGFTLKEVKSLIDLNSSSRATCENVRERAIAKRNEISEKIQDLQRMQAALLALEKACEQSPEQMACCRISDCFAGKCTEEEEYR